MENPLSTDELTIIIKALSMAIMVTLSVYGTNEGMAMAGTAASLQSQKKTLTTAAWLTMIMIFTIFFLSLILCLIFMQRLYIKNTMSQALTASAGCIGYGMASLICGKAAGVATKKGFKRMSTHSSFFSTYLLMLTSLEIMVIFSFLLSMIILNSTSKE